MALRTNRDRADVLLMDIVGSVLAMQFIFALFFGVYDGPWQYLAKALGSAIGLYTGIQHWREK